MKPSFFKKLGPIKTNSIKDIIGCDLHNINNNDEYNELVSLSNAKSSKDLTFIYDNENFIPNLLNKPSIICTSKKYLELKNKFKLIIVKDVQKSVSILSNKFYRDFTNEEISNFRKPTIGEGSKISKNAIIENGASIGKNVTIQDGACIKNGTIIGDNSYIDYNSVISNSIFGENVFIGRNCSIGQQGFGFSIYPKKNIKIFHIGRVIIQANVNIGSNCSIDRGSFGDTIIGENTFLDNLCHIAHNVVIGSNCVFAAMTGIAGSAKIGDYVLAGGQAGIAGHISVGNNVKIAAKSAVFNSLNDGETVMGNPAISKFKYIKRYKKTYG
tara:strand:- start:1649 stop:2629 length:981 start_codon:yes stop_codon:yes gene_type:complete